MAKKEIKEDLILAYALENAVTHNGKAQPGAVLPKLFQVGLEKSKIKEIMPKITKVVANVNSMTGEQQQKELEAIKSILPEKKREEKEGLPELPNAEKGKVIMRHAPFPSGPLHIGNAVPIIINDEYVRKYNGQAILVIDDTIGSEEKQIAPEAYNLIPEGLKWLDAKYSSVIYKSDRLNIYYKYAESLIKKDKAYVCFCNIERLRANRASGKNCECRIKDYTTNLRDWKWMFGPDAKEGAATLRLKTSMQHPNPAFRDRVLFRISERVHPRVKGLKVWPLLEFSWAVDDHLLEITHIIRGNQLAIESEMEKFIWDIFEWPHPVIVHTPLLMFDGVKLSKSKSQAEVKQGTYIGWDDPRTWSLQSLEKRGISPQALRKFIIEFGMSEKESITVPIDMLYAENKKIIGNSDRYFFVANPIKIKISKAKRSKTKDVFGAPKIAAFPAKMKIKIPIYAEDLNRGEREFSTGTNFFITADDFNSLEEGKVYRLMHLFNFQKLKGKFVFHSLERDPKLDTKMIHWLPALKTTPKAKVLMSDGTTIEGYVEKAVKKLKSGTIVQFERFAFCKLNSNPKKGIIDFWWTHK